MNWPMKNAAVMLHAIANYQHSMVEPCWIAQEGEWMTDPAGVELHSKRIQSDGKRSMFH